MRITETCPILRIFDEEKALAHYRWLGFREDWRHRFAPDMPLYLQISQGGLVLHLSEHYGDASPGATVFLRVEGLRTFHANLAPNPRMRPGLDQQPWGLEMTVTDPFGNRLRFCEG